MRSRNYYEILGISATATPDEIKKAYNKRALKVHPDKLSVSEEASAALFVEVNTAYETLSDAAKRSQYDKMIGINTLNQTHVVTSQNIYTGYNANNRTQSFWNINPQSNKNVNIGIHDFQCFYADNAELKDIIQYDDIDYFIQFLLINPNYIDDRKNLFTIVAFAAQCGSLKIVRHLIGLKEIDPNITVTSSSGSPFYFRSFEQCSIFKYAIKSGNLNLVKYLHKERHADIKLQLIYAVRYGHIDIINYLIENGANVNPEVACSNIMKEAIQSGNIAIFDLLLNKGLKMDYSELSTAIQCGDLMFAKYFLEKEPDILKHKFSDSPAYLVVRSGNFELLKYLEGYNGLQLFAFNSYDKSIPIGDIGLRLIEAAAESANVNMMQYLFEKDRISRYLKELYEGPTKISKASTKYSILAHILVYAAGGISIRGTVENRLDMIKFLMEKIEFKSLANKSKSNFERVIRCACDEEIKTYLQTYLSRQKKSNRTDSARDDDFYAKRRRLA